MATGYDSGIWSRIRPKIQQWESVTGRRIDPSAIRSLADAEFDTQKKTANASKYLDIEQQRVDLVKKQAEDAAKGNTYKGVSELATTGIGLYGLGKEAGLWGGAKATGLVGAAGTNSLSIGGFSGGIGATSPTIMGSGAAMGAQAQLPAGSGLLATAPIADTSSVVAGGSGGAIGGSTTGTGLGSAMGGLGAVGAGAAIGSTLGRVLSRNQYVQKTTPWGGEKTERMAASTGMGMAGGALAGAAYGSIGGLPGALVGAVVGGIIGAVGGSCIIVTACHGKDSPEVAITREYRDRFMDKDQIRGYYMIAEKIVPLMKESEELTELIKLTLIDKLIEYGKFKLGMKSAISLDAIEIAESFLKLCKITGQSVTEFTRSNGEVI